MFFPSPYWILLYSKGYGDRKEKNENTGEREQNRQMTEDKWREEMQPESLEREALKNHYNM